MALTSEQKERNKLARNARDRAYHARYKEVSAFETAGEASVDAEFKDRVGVLDQAEKALMEARDSAVGEINAKIAELMKEKESVEAVFKERFSLVRSDARVLWDQIRSRKEGVKAESLEKFPDMNGSCRWSAAVWGVTDYARSILNDNVDSEADVDVEQGVTP